MHNNNGLLVNTNGGKSIKIANNNITFLNGDAFLLNGSSQTSINDNMFEAASGYEGNVVIQINNGAGHALSNNTFYDLFQGTSIVVNNVPPGSYQLANNFAYPILD